MTVFHLIMNHTSFHLVQDKMENCQYDPISFNLKGNLNLFLRVSVKEEENLRTVSVAHN